MNQVPDRKRLRREYLQKIAVGNGMIISGMIICPLLGIITFLLALTTIGTFVFACLDRSLELIGWSFVAAAVTACSGWLTRRSLSLVDKGLRVAGIPVVPPVTASTLPAEEILVRAADEPPVAQSTILLRAAQQGQETPNEELLRVSLGE